MEEGKYKKIKKVFFFRCNCIFFGVKIKVIIKLVNNGAKNELFEQIDEFIFYRYGY